MLGFSPSQGYITAAFGNRQLLGAFLTGLLPVAVVIASSGATKVQRLIAWGAVPLAARSKATVTTVIAPLRTAVGAGYTEFRAAGLTVATVDMDCPINSR